MSRLGAGVLVIVLAMLGFAGWQAAQATEVDAASISEVLASAATSEAIATPEPTVVQSDAAQLYVASGVQVCTPIPGTDEESCVLRVTFKMALLAGSTVQICRKQAPSEPMLDGSDGTREEMIVSWAGHADFVQVAVTPPDEEQVFTGISPTGLIYPLNGRALWCSKALSS